MSDIGHGDWVQAVCDRETPPFAPFHARLVSGAVYQVRALSGNARRYTHTCGWSGSGIWLVGQPDFFYASGHYGGWCPCAFRKWPPPADEALRSEQSPYHEQEPTREPV